MMWLKQVFSRRRIYRDLSEEIREHIEEKTEELVAGGMSKKEAAAAARRAFGNVSLAEEDSRAVWRWQFIEEFVVDVRYGLRVLRKSPGFTAVVILTLALGIGANTTIFSVINATLLREPPFPEANRLVLLWETVGGPRNWSIISAPNFWDYRRQSRSFDGLAIFDSGGRGYNLSATGTKHEAEQVSGVRVSADFFSVLGVKPLLGRTFLAEEETLGKDHEVILSYNLWTRRYGNAQIVGKTIKIDGEDFTVVGVMPAEFQWQFWSGERQLWVPVGYTKTDYERGQNGNSFVAFGRLKPDVTVAQAQTEVEGIASRLTQQYPKENAGISATVIPLGDFGMESLRPAMLARQAAVGVLLLIACVNVANVLLSRGTARQKEFATRRALGAPRSRIARQLLTESLLLAVLGGAAALPLATWSNQLLFHSFRLDNMHLPLRVVNSIGIDGRVFGFALLVSCVTGVLFGVAPALSVLRGHINDPLKEGGRGGTSDGRTRLRNVLVASEVALALVLMCGAGLMIESFARLLGVDPGFNPGNVLTMQMSLPQEDIYTGPPGLPRFCQDVHEHVGVIPGVVSVGAVAQLPFEGSAGQGFQVEGQPPAEPGQVPVADYSVSCPNYFRTIGIPVVTGREFTHRDVLNAPGVIVINESMARFCWPKEDPVGRAIRLGGPNGLRLTVVGVVGDVPIRGLDERVRRQFFRPYTQAAWPVMNIVVRTAAAPINFTGPIKKALAEVLPDRPVSQVETMEDIVRDSTGSRRFPMLLLTTFSLLALVLAAVGIIGVVSYSVTQRTRELGIRMALGARSGDVLSLVLRGSVKCVLLGIVVGIAGSIGFARLLSSMLYGVRPIEPAVLS